MKIVLTLAVLINALVIGPVLGAHIRNLASDPNCSKFAADGSCQLCVPKAIKTNGACIEIVCKGRDPVTGDCTQCYTGFILSSGICTIPQPSPTPSPTPQSFDPNCNKFAANGSCQICSFRSVKINGVCVRVSDLCKEWDPVTGNCTQCYLGYTLSLGKCTTSLSTQTTSGPQVVQQIDPNCNKFAADGSCQKCSWRSVKINGVCQRVSDLCLQWDQATGKCTQCYGGYTVKNGNCVVA